MSPSNGILSMSLPHSPIVKDILKLGTEAMGTPIEIEFAVNLNRKAPKKPEFSLLQIRPIAQGNEESDVEITQQERESAAVLSTVIMGNGKITDIHDIIYIKQESFDPSRMQEMAVELDKLNATMVLQDKDYVLIVAGRLGSCDPWLGIPVTWSQISRSRVIVETGFEGFQVEPSQGTHFFQNMTSLGCIYMTVNPIYKSGKLDLKRFSSLPVYDETPHFIHARSEKPLTIKVNGFKGEGVLCL